MGLWPRTPESPATRLVRTAWAYAEKAPTTDLGVRRTWSRNRQIGKAATRFIDALAAVTPDHPVVVRNRDELRYFEGEVLDAAAVVIAATEFADVNVIANPANGEGFDPPLEAA